MNIPCRANKSSASPVVQSLLLPVLLRSFEQCGAAAGVSALVLLLLGVNAPTYTCAHGHRVPSLNLLIQLTHQVEPVTALTSCLGLLIGLPAIWITWW